MEPDTLRADIPALQDGVYLNTGASSPSPRTVVDAVTEFLHHQQFDAPSAEGPYPAAMDLTERARETVASHLGASSAEIALTDSTVDGINHVATSIDWNPGDVVVRTDLEHPAGVLPWARMRDLHGIEIRTVSTEAGRVDLDALRSAVEDARLLCVSSVSWNYGTQLPVSEIVDIAHETDTLVMLDAVQSPGQMPVDVDTWGADFIAGSGHKWLLGPWGAGFLYVDRGALAELQPQRIGYFGVDLETMDGNDYEYEPDASRFELGTDAVAAYAGLMAGIETIESVGFSTIQQRVQRLTDQLKQGLGERLLSPDEYESGLVAFNTDDPDGLVDRLAAAGIQIRSIPEPHACRVSLHVYNSADDVEALLAALE